jgi:hypothetical protein
MLLNAPSKDFSALGALIMATVIPAIELDAASQELINGELAWLFSAADNLMQVILNQADRNQTVAVPIPPTAQKLPQANNQLLEIPNDPRYNERDGYEALLRGKSSLIGWDNFLNSYYNRINTNLNNLNILLKQEAKAGEAAKGDVLLQNNIKGIQFDIIRVLPNLAQLMYWAYGIQVTSPDKLVEFLQS